MLIPQPFPTLVPLTIEKFQLRPDTLNIPLILKSDFFFLGLH
jgi:hypothetical protein